MQDSVDGTDDKITDKAQRVAYEILTTEKAYVEKLHLIDQVIFSSVTVRNLLCDYSFLCLNQNLDN